MRLKLNYSKTIYFVTDIHSSKGGSGNDTLYY